MINQVDLKGRTMLHYAASKGDIYCVDKLIKKGADVTIKDNYNFSAYGLAMREEQYETAFKLLL